MKTYDYRLLYAAIAAVLAIGIGAAIHHYYDPILFWTIK
jgi:hypothetical protein